MGSSEAGWPCRCCGAASAAVGATAEDHSENQRATVSASTSRRRGVKQRDNPGLETPPAEADHGHLDEPDNRGE